MYTHARNRPTGYRTVCRSRELNYIVLSYRGTVDVNSAIENNSSLSTGHVNRIDIVINTLSFRLLRSVRLLRSGAGWAKTNGDRAVKKLPITVRKTAFIT